MRPRRLAYTTRNMSAATLLSIETIWSASLDGGDALKTTKRRITGCGVRQHLPAAAPAQAPRNAHPWRDSQRRGGAVQHQPDALTRAARH